MTKTISAPLPADQLPKPDEKTTWSFLKDLEVGTGTVVNGYNKKALSRVRERFKKKGITISVTRTENKGEYTVIRTA